MPRSLIPFILSLAVIFATAALTAEDHGAKELIEAVEANPAIEQAVKQLARERQLPLSISANDGALAQATSIEANEILYLLMPNPAHPYRDSELLTLDQLSQRIDLSTAQLTYPMTAEKSQSN